VIGLGYIGLPTAALLASKEFNVVGVDTDENVVNIINKGEIHIIEPSLMDYVSKAVRSNFLKAYTEPQESDIYIICVPTPFYDDSEIPEPNIEFVLDAVNSILHLLKEGDTIILESTSPVGTSEKILSVLNNHNLKNINLAYCPERVLPGNIMHELVTNDRVVGGIDKNSTDFVSSFFKIFVEGEVIETDSKTAEMCKLVENSFRDINIAFANELSILCDNKGIDPWELINIANRHPRVNILKPGPGVGGHCIAVDPWFIVSMDEKNSKLIKTAREVNNFKTKWAVNKIKTTISDISHKIGRQPRLSFLGLSFKPDIDDLRESPAMKIVEKFKKNDYEFIVSEPNISTHSDFKITTYQEAIENSDVIVILVKHKEFLDLNFPDDKVVIDFCGINEKS
tara:strand:- start:3730 stop:4920 length:1191 start_codon:yes stop_codon:yes gene_type:complete